MAVERTHTPRTRFQVPFVGLLGLFALPMKERTFIPEMKDAMDTKMIIISCCET